jgi:hypothetical protein
VQWLYVISISNFKSLPFWKGQRSWFWFILLWTLHELSGLCMHVFLKFWWQVNHCWKWINDFKKDQKNLCHYNPSYLQPPSQRHVKPFANPPHLRVQFLNECCLSEWIYIIKWCSLQWSFKYFDYLVMPRGYIHLWGTYHTNYFIITNVFKHHFHKFNGMAILLQFDCVITHNMLEVKRRNQMLNSSCFWCVDSSIKHIQMLF